MGPPSAGKAMLASTTLVSARTGSRRVARNDAAGFTSCCGPATRSAPLRTRALDHARGPHRTSPVNRTIDRVVQRARSLGVAFDVVIDLEAGGESGLARHGAAGELM
jgi:hypothetical protein